MKNSLFNPLFLNRLILVAGIILVTESLIRHPENWQIRLGILVVVLVVTLAVLYLIRYLRTRGKG